jgi:cytochrome c biogenesis protein CcdA
VSTEPPAAGWYADPTQSGRQRYWDGQNWADQYKGQIAEAPKPIPRYQSLRIIAGLFKGLAWLTAVAGTIGVIAGASKSEESGSLVLLGLLFVAATTLALFAYAAFIQLAINVEENTRQSAELLARQVNS